MPLTLNGKCNALLIDKKFESSDVKVPPFGERVVSTAPPLPADAQSSVPLPAIALMPELLPSSETKLVPLPGKSLGPVFDQTPAEDKAQPLTPCSNLAATTTITVPELPAFADAACIRLHTEVMRLRRELSRTQAGAADEDARRVALSAHLEAVRTESVRGESVLAAHRRAAAADADERALAMRDSAASRAEAVAADNATAAATSSASALEAAAERDGKRLAALKKALSVSTGEIEHWETARREAACNGEVARHYARGDSARATALTRERDSLVEAARASTADANASRAEAMWRAASADRLQIDLHAANEASRVTLAQLGEATAAAAARTDAAGRSRAAAAEADIRKRAAMAAGAEANAVADAAAAAVRVAIARGAAASRRRTAADRNAAALHAAAAEVEAAATAAEVDARTAVAELSAARANAAGAAAAAAAATFAASKAMALAAARRKAVASASASEGADATSQAAFAAVAFLAAARKRAEDAERHVRDRTSEIAAATAERASLETARENACVEASGARRAARAAAARSASLIAAAAAARRALYAAELRTARAEAAAAEAAGENMDADARAALESRRQALLAELDAAAKDERALRDRARGAGAAARAAATTCARAITKAAADGAAAAEALLQVNAAEQEEREAAAAMAAALVIRDAEALVARRARASAEARGCELDEANTAAIATASAATARIVAAEESLAMHRADAKLAEDERRRLASELATARTAAAGARARFSVLAARARGCSAASAERCCGMGAVDYDGTDSDETGSDDTQAERAVRALQARIAARAQEATERRGAARRAADDAEAAAAAAASELATMHEALTHTLACNAASREALRKRYCGGNSGSSKALAHMRRETAATQAATAAAERRLNSALAMSEAAARELASINASSADDTARADASCASAAASWAAIDALRPQLRERSSSRHGTDVGPAAAANAATAEEMLIFAAASREACTAVIHSLCTALRPTSAPAGTEAGQSSSLANESADEAARAFLADALATGLRAAGIQAHFPACMMTTGPLVPPTVHSQPERQDASLLRAAVSTAASSRCRGSRQASAGSAAPSMKNPPMSQVNASLQQGSARTPPPLISVVGSTLSRQR